MTEGISTVILTLHVLIVLGLIVMVLLQRSDGSALGIGGGGGGGFMSGRSAANALTRTTSVLAAVFFATSLGLAIIAGAGESEESVIEELTGEPTSDDAAPASGVSTDDLLNTLGGEGDDAAAEEGEPAPVGANDVLDALGAEIAAEEEAGPLSDPNAAPAEADAPADSTAGGETPDDE